VRYRHYSTFCPPAILNNKTGTIFYSRCCLCDFLSSALFGKMGAQDGEIALMVLELSRNFPLFRIFGNFNNTGL